MSIIGRSLSLLLISPLKILVAGVCGAVITTALLVFAGTLVGSAGVSRGDLPLFAGIIGGTISGYFWGKVFAKLEYGKHKRMMAKEGIEVFDNT